MPSKLSTSALCLLGLVAAAAPVAAQVPAGTATTRVYTPPTSEQKRLGGGMLPGDPNYAPNRYKLAPKVLYTEPVFAAALTKAMAQSGTSLPGTSLRTACDGFDTVGNCVAAVHAAKALGSNAMFDALRQAMVEGDKLKLADAIARVKPDADARGIERDAIKKAKENCALVAASGY